MNMKMRSEMEVIDDIRTQREMLEIIQELLKVNVTRYTVLTENKETMEENSNKNAVLVSTQRDLIAGECSKDLADRIMLPERIVKAHNDGVLHFHDKDYFVQPMHNCCLVNIGDMLDNGTVMNGKMIESPKSFQVACTVMTQIIAAVASSQYGGQSVDIRHLGKYLRKSYDKFYKELKSGNRITYCRGYFIYGNDDFFIIRKRKNRNFG